MVGGPSCCAKCRLVQDACVETDETFTDAIVVVVQVAQSEVVEREVLVHEKRHGGRCCCRGWKWLYAPARLAGSRNAHSHVIMARGVLLAFAVWILEQLKPKRLLEKVGSRWSATARRSEVIVWARVMHSLRRHFALKQSHASSTFDI